MMLCQTFVMQDAKQQYRNREILEVLQFLVNIRVTGDILISHFDMHKSIYYLLEVGVGCKLRSGESSNKDNRDNILIRV